MSDKLHQRIAKLDALASDRNPNAAEREAARNKANKLRQKLPAPKRLDPFFERLVESVARTTVEQVREALIQKLAGNLNQLKPGDRLMATELCMTYHTRGLVQREWNMVNMFLQEINAE